MNKFQLMLLKKLLMERESNFHYENLKKPVICRFFVAIKNRVKIGSVYNFLIASGAHGFLWGLGANWPAHNNRKLVFILGMFPFVLGHNFPAFFGFAGNDCVDFFLAVGRKFFCFHIRHLLHSFELKKC